MQLHQGRAAYVNADLNALALLQGLEIIPVQRNSGIDAFVKFRGDNLIPVRVQRLGEGLSEAAIKLNRAMRSKNFDQARLIMTHEALKPLFEFPLPDSITLIYAPSIQIRRALQSYSPPQADPDLTVQHGILPRP